MEARSLPEAFILIMEQRGCSQRQLARDLRKGSGWVSDVINGKAGLDFAKMINFLSRVGWEVVIRPKTEKSDPVKRRKFVTATASVMFVPSPRVGPNQDPAYVRELARRVNRARYEHGGGTIAATAIKHVRRIEPAVTSKDRQLQEAASELAAETVWTLNDACRVEAGENVGRLALQLAKLSGSLHAESEAYDALAAINLDHGETDRALMYAKHGVMLREVPDAQQAWMRIRTGWSLAHVRGQENVARDEIENVRGLLRDTYGFSSPGKRTQWGQYGKSSLEAADMMGTIALSLNDLGVYGEAQAAFNECVSVLEQSSPALAAFFLSHQIMAALGASQLSLAADRMLKLARITPLVNSPRVNGYLREILAMSATWGTVPRIRNARDQLKAVALPGPLT
jgi:predicted XRE-type DNA-binding protein